MILIDAIYINNSGGKVLLDYLIQELEKSGKSVFYLLDKRVENKIAYLANTKNEVLFLKAYLVKRHIFYKNNINRFSKILCFGNLAPSIKMEIPVYTYFHQTIFLKIPKEFKLYQKLMFRIKIFIFSYLLKNSDYIIVQSNLIKDNISKKFNFNPENILLISFYPDKDLKNKNAFRDSNSYIYVSSGAPHKNHIRLLNAFCKFHDLLGTGILYLTVDIKEFVFLGKLINDKITNGYPIVNLGFVDREKLIEKYNKSEYLIYPSLEESLGLGIVEAIECGCKVIGADLPYMYEVCEPSLKFNPFEEECIYQAFIDSTKDNVISTQQIIQNEINQLITLLN